MGTHISRGTSFSLLLDLFPFRSGYVRPGETGRAADGISRAWFCLVKSVDLDIWQPDQIEVCLPFPVTGLFYQAPLQLLKRPY
jgi:hypothetical protein